MSASATVRTLAYLSHELEAAHRESASDNDRCLSGLLRRDHPVLWAGRGLRSRTKVFASELNSGRGRYSPPFSAACDTQAVIGDPDPAHISTAL